MKRVYVLLAALLFIPLTYTNAVAQERYTVKPGDVLRIEVLEDNTINRETLVLPDGQISVPLAGTVAAKGKTLSQIKADVASALAPNFANVPTVFVSLASLAVPRSSGRSTSAATSKVDVYVLGEVAKPGKVEVETGTTLLQVLAEIGGFSKFAAKKRIQLRRADSAGVEKVYSVNYQDILAGKTNIGMTVLAPGDVIIVPQRKLFE
ncbi:Polysaccharide biosynthesis/export protein [Roseovarius litorisediminis]|uniref:Polysaccharide biosynthesis/export protein n=1 Tax=Roseovarius litorisediminis TaxID=1312363 RepID=A0A1Y5SWS2_9RHOB|nr:polysaccharide biosynthesis/export family protein [Roseovarius litorisediminis]SLN46871.1 Polysaccharide biosynthesis/export protein [Roseovarius litorisediminis]